MNPVFPSQQFSQFTQQAERVAAMLASPNPRMQMLGELALAQLQAEFDLLFPDSAAERSAKAKAHAERVLRKQHDLWRQLHQRPFDLAFQPSESDMAFLVSIGGEIPGCAKCATNYANFIKNYPPDFSSAKTYFAWTVKLHNHVNRELGKPELTVEAARAVWVPSPT